MLFDTRPKVQVTIVQTGERFPCAVGESLLAGMLRLGRRGIPAGCVNGGCGVCKVQVVAGRTQTLGPISRAHVDHQEEASGFTLACRAAPLEDVQIELAGRIARPVMRAAGARGGPPAT